VTKSPPRIGTVGALRILLVVNSFASSVTARNTVIVHRRLSRGHDVQIVETNRRGHATRFAHDAARRGLDVVIGFGGDGTLNEVATGIAGTDTALGVLPGGRPTSSPARSVCPTIRSRPPTTSPTASMPPIYVRSGWGR
jgi:predicted polyphosphate/ATP-dependent NAD kinase